MKRYLLLMIPLILILTLFLGSCSLGEMTRENELKTAMESTYEELDSTFSGDSGKYSLVAEYLKSWANKNDIEITENNKNHMVMINPATDGYKDAQTTVFQCAVKTNDFNNSMQTLSTALTALLGPEKHGKLKLIITENNDGQFTGAESVDSKYYKCDNFINLERSDDIQLYTSGAYEMSSTMTSSIETASPSYSHAYAITMSISGYHDPFDFDRHYPNPIETIGSLLATEKSSGQLFHLASFECESTSSYTPTSATAVVVIDSNDIESFEKKFDKSYNSVKNKLEKLNDNFVYTFTETSMPETVMSSQTSDSIISLMYTLQTGTYLQDEESGEIISASDISSVTTAEGTFKLTMISRSLEENVLSDMSSEFLTTSGLCNISYEASEPQKTWSSDSKKGPAAFLSKALGSEDSIIPATLENSECGVFASKQDLNMVSYRFNVHHSDAALMNIIHFVESLTELS